jgi:ribose transport system ATP-binding protein
MAHASHNGAGSAGSSAGGPLIAFRNITKRFGSTEALSCVSIDGDAGSVHAVTGENGAGKSTLMNLLAGIHQPDAGEILLRGVPIAPANPSESRHLGISTIFQELTLVPNLSVAENMFLGREPRRAGLLDHARMRREARAALDRLGSRISPDTFCSELSVGEQQLVEIARGVTAEAEVFIFDEPTAALNTPEIEKLAELIAALKAAGKLVFYISHRLEEIFRFCDTVSVLKDGAHVATHPVGEIDHDRLVTLMVGRTLGQLFPDRPGTDPAAPAALAVERLQAAHDGPEVSLALHRGEILGLAGLEGQGQRAIMRAIAGLEPPAHGHIGKADRDGHELRTVHHDIVSATLAGIGFVPEDRKVEGLYLPLSIERNMSLGMLRKRHLWHRARVRGADIARLLERMRVQASDAGQAVGALSGGNQQKVMIGRWLASGSDVLLIEEPTRGVDVGAKAEIYNLLRGFADAGGAVLIISSELTEVLGLCDRVLVVRAGALVAEFPGTEANEEDVMRAALTGQPATARESVPA